SACSQTGWRTKAKRGRTGASARAASSRRGVGRGAVAGSPSSQPNNTSAMSAAASTLGANTPIVSRLGDVSSTPVRGTAPKVGLKPTTPQKAAGLSVEPPVCVPTASGTMPAATAAAEPEDEPPGVRLGSCGLRVGPGAMYASSAVTVLPRITAPACFKRATAQ